MRLLNWTLGLVVAAQAGAALAEEPPVDLLEPREKAPAIETLRAVHLRGLSSRELRDETPDASPPRERRIDHLQAAKGGFKFQDSFEFAGRSYRYSVRGPVQKDRQFGLTFELRF